MTDADYFLKSVQGLYRQGFQKSIRSRSIATDGTVSGHCGFRDNDGRKCAVGQLIDDKDYKPTMDLVSWDWLSFQDAGFFPGLSRSLYRKLQLAHDGANGPEDVRFRLFILAKDHGFPIPTELDLTTPMPETSR